MPDPNWILQMHRREVATRIFKQYGLEPDMPETVGRFMVLERGRHVDDLAMTFHEHNTDVYVWVDRDHDMDDWEVSKIFDLDHEKQVPFSIRPRLEMSSHHEGVPV